MPAYKRDLSKSKLISYRQCPKRLWLEIHRPELRQDSASSQAVFRTGHQVGDLARQIFDPSGQGVLVDLHADGYKAAIEKTATLTSGDKPIFEAGFAANGAMAFCDVLIPSDADGVRSWRMIEVKASTSVKPYYEDDVAIQSLVARASGVNLSGVSLAHIDSSWVYPGGGDYSGLLVEKDLTIRAFSRVDEVQGWIDAAQKVASQPNPPAIDTGPQCEKPFPCGFAAHCNEREQPVAYPITWVPRVQGKALKQYIAENNVEEMRQLPRELLNPQQLRVLEHTLTGECFFDGAGALADLAAYPLPALFLDFETISFGVPIWAGTRPFQSLTFQFSVHAMAADGSLSHAEFLDMSGSDPRKAFATALLSACEIWGPIFVYNAGFEGTRIRELSDAFPALRTGLLAIKGRLVDLHPIAVRRFYHPSQQGSWSIKKVLPAIAPELAYESLGGVQNGDMAMDAYLESLDPETQPVRREEIRQQLLAYCKLDTLAMVRIWQKFTGRELN